MAVVVNHSGNREEVIALLQGIISFVLSVAAGVACHLICKWLDERNHDDD